MPATSTRTASVVGTSVPATARMPLAARLSPLGRVGPTLVFGVAATGAIGALATLVATTST